MSKTIEHIAAVVNEKSRRVTFSQVGEGGISVRRLFEKQKAYFASDVTKSYEWRVEQLDRLIRMLKGKLRAFFRSVTD